MMMTLWSYLFTATPVQFRGCQNVRDSSEPMEQHSGKLDDENEGKEEHKHQTDGLQLEVFFGDQHLGVQERQISCCQ